jgi:hypothetical protein
MSLTRLIKYVKSWLTSIILLNLYIKPTRSNPTHEYKLSSQAMSIIRNSDPL